MSYPPIDLGPAAQKAIRVSFIFFGSFSLSYVVLLLSNFLKSKKVSCSKLSVSIIIGGALSILYGFPEVFDQLSFIKALITGSLTAAIFFTLSHGESVVGNLIFFVISRGLSLNAKDDLFKEVRLLNSKEESHKGENDGDKK